jgi:hypothetical protein
VPTSTIADDRLEKLLDTLLAIATLSIPNMVASCDASSTASLASHIIQLYSM